MAEKSNNLNTEEEILSNPPSNGPSQHSLSLNSTISNANDDADDRNSATTLPNSRETDRDHNCNIPTATESVTVSKAVSGDLRKLSVGQLVAQLKMARTRIRELELEKAKILGCPITTSLDSNTNKTSCDKDKILQKRSTPSFFKDLNLDDFLRQVREDMSNDDLNSESQTIFDGGTWEKCSESEDESQDIREKNQKDDFPLIPSPVLNTPPYEYIFLTRENEAKFRIFLNQKLNKVFQEELHKLQNQDESDCDEESLGDKHENTEADGTKADKTNRLSNCHSMGLIETKSNVIHCFDPSDVDLELKKIFTDKPPTTHKIVRRKPRLDRGSSVPAVDSYYGTSDLNKVGHASYFIPLLTESERKAIGWKPDYHFGHWKYTTMNIPNIRMNPISLHPHPHLDDSLTSHKHSHHHKHHLQDHLLSQNPLHQKEINFSDPFLFDSDDSTKHATHHSKTSCPNPIHKTKLDSMSFITLSGDSGDPSSHSCHIIPDRCTLKKILKWILPSCVSSKKSEKLSFNPGHSRSEVGENDNHEIQTIVAAPDKLVFATSHTHISFAALKSGEMVNNDTPSNDNMQDVQEPNHKQRTNTTDPHNKGEKSNSHHHHHHLRSRDEHHDHKNHSHHHGIFHWINLLHGSRKSDDSMSVVGGDVLVSSQGSVIVPVNQQREDRMSSENGLQQSFREKAIRPFDYNSFTDTETEDEAKPGGEKKIVKRRKGLKPSRAYDKLLTLKDLGYQTDHGGSVGEESDSAGEEAGQNTKTKKSSSRSPTLPATPQGYLKRTGRLICDKQKKKTLIKGAGRKSKQVLAKKNQKKKHITLSIENDADDDFSSGSGSNFSPPNVASQQISAATHFDDEDTLPNFIPSLMRGMIHTDSNATGIESRFLDPKDIVQTRFQDKLPFVYDVGESFLDAGDLFSQDDYVLEWMDNNFEEFEEGLGLLKSCLGTVIHSDDGFVNTSEIVICDKKNEIIAGKVEGQHRIVTLNELDSKDDADNMNQAEHIIT